MGGENSRVVYGFHADTPAMGPEELMTYVILFAIALAIAALGILQFAWRKRAGPIAEKRFELRLRRIKYLGVLALLVGAFHLMRDTQRIFAIIGAAGNPLEWALGEFSEELDVTLLAIGVAIFANLVCLVLFLQRRPDAAPREEQAEV